MFHNTRHPNETGGPEIEQFLTYLASKQEFIKILARIPSAIALPLNCLKQAMISAPFKNFSVTSILKQQ
jgi:hypothetical protein